MYPYPFAGVSLLMEHAPRGTVVALSRSLSLFPRKGKRPRPLNETRILPEAYFEVVNSLLTRATPSKAAHRKALVTRFVVKRKLVHSITVAIILNRIT